MLAQIQVNPRPLLTHEYVDQLATEGHVLVDMAVRRETIYQQVIALATKLGGEAVLNEDLLDEVTGLVEWPVALSGAFDKIKIGSRIFYNI